MTIESAMPAMSDVSAMAVATGRKIVASLEDRLEARGPGARALVALIVRMRNPQLAMKLRAPCITDGESREP